MSGIPQVQAAPGVDPIGADYSDGKTGPGLGKRSSLPEGRTRGLKGALGGSISCRPHVAPIRWRAEALAYWLGRRPEAGFGSRSLGGCRRSYTRPQGGRTWRPIF
jgi:hypothetical protein